MVTKDPICSRFRPRRRIPVGSDTLQTSAQADQKPQSRMQNLLDDAAAGLTPQDIDAAWVKLLEETLPPDTQEALMVTYESEKDPKMRYNMLLEFSSYLQQVPSCRGRLRRLQALHRTHATRLPLYLGYAWGTL